MKTLGFIVPIYNVELQYVKKCLDSLHDSFLKNQDLEIVIIDNGNQIKQFLWLLENYSKYPEFKIFRINNNDGKTQAIDLGIKQLNTKYFQVVDADDWIDFKKINEIVDSLILTNGDFYILKYTYFNNQNETFKTRRIKKTFKKIKRFAKVPVFVWHFECNVIRKKSLFINNDFFFPHYLKFYEDIFTNAWCLDKGLNFYFINETYYFYRVKQKGINLSSTTKLIEKNVDFYQALLAIIEFVTFKNQLTRRHLINYYGYQILAYIFWWSQGNKKLFTRKPLKQIRKFTKEKNPYLFEATKTLKFKYFKLNNSLTLYGYNLFLYPAGKILKYLRK